MIPNIENYFIQIAFVLYDDILERNYRRTFECPQFLWVLFYHSFERLKQERHNGLVKEFKVSNSTWKMTQAFCIILEELICQPTESNLLNLIWWLSKKSPKEQD